MINKEFLQKQAQLPVKTQLMGCERALDLFLLLLHQTQCCGHLCHELSHRSAAETALRVKNYLINTGFAVWVIQVVSVSLTL